MSDKSKYTAENIQSLEFSEHIRKKPGMYIGSIDSKGFMSIVNGIICETFENDKMMNDISFEIVTEREAKITLKSQNEEIINKWQIKKSNYLNTNKWSLHYMDLTALNALSSHFKVTLKNNKQIVHQEFYKQGIATNSDVKEKVTANLVEFEFKLDEQIWGSDFSLNQDYLNHHIRELAFLKKESKIRLQYTVDNEKCNIIHHFKNGLQDKLEIEQINGIGKTYFETHINENLDGFNLEVAFRFRGYTVDQSFLQSYVNYHYTPEDGAHIDGLLKGLTYGVMKYFQKHNLLDSYKISEKGIREELIASVHIKMDDPMFSGCVKNKLANSDIIEPMSKRIAELLFEKIEKDEESTKKLISKFEIQ